jgi:hypothetical protein
MRIDGDGIVCWGHKYLNRIKIFRNLEYSIVYWWMMGKYKGNSAKDMGRQSPRQAYLTLFLLG